MVSQAAEKALGLVPPPAVRPPRTHPQQLEAHGRHATARRACQQQRAGIAEQRALSSSAICLHLVGDGRCAHARLGERSSAARGAVR